MKIQYCQRIRISFVIEEYYICHNSYDGIEVWVMKQWIKNNKKIDKKVVNSDRKLRLEKKPSFSKWSPDFHANGTIFKFSNFVATERKCSARVVRQHRLSRYTSTSDTSISTAFRKWSNFFWKIFCIKKIKKLIKK